MIADEMLAAHALIQDRPALEQQERLAVVQEALTWLGTPWHHQARVRGAGVDCGQFLAAVLEDAGLIPHVDPGSYPQDFMLHSDEGRFQALVEQHAAQVDRGPLPGDILLFRFGRCLSHGAISLGGTRIVHSYLDHGVPRGVTVDDLAQNLELAERMAGAWSTWGEA